MISAVLSSFSFMSRGSWIFENSHWKSWLELLKSPLARVESLENHVNPGLRKTPVTMTIGGVPPT